MGAILRKIIIAAVLALAGCATQMMDEMVGKDIAEIQVKYGPPSHVMKMPDGRTAFQWRMDQSYVMPTNTTSYTTGNVYGTSNAATYYGTTNTQTSGGGVFAQTCFYTLYAQKNSRNSYTVTSFEPPTFDCN